MTQEEKLFARIQKWLQEAPPAHVVKFNVVLDRSGKPLVWWADEPVKLEGNTKPDEEKPQS